MAKNIKSMASAQSGTGATAEAYSKLGISVTNADGSLRNSQDVFNDSINALGNVANETERDTIAMQLFGKSAQDLNPLIEGGADALKELGDNAQNMGLIMSQDGLDNLNAFNDSLDVLKANASASGKMIAGAFAGKFKVATDLIGGAVPELAKGFSDLFTSTDIDGATDNLTNKLTDLGQKYY